MKKKIICILVCTLLMVVTPGIVAQNIELNQHFESALVEKVKEIPFPWQNWLDEQGGVIDIIVLDQEVENPVAILRDYVVLDEEIPLDDLTWEDTLDLDWIVIDPPGEQYILYPGDTVQFFILTNPQNRAVLVRYSVAWASTPTVIEAHFVNEAILDTRAIVGSLSNFDVHNDYNEAINNFELEFYGKITSVDIIYVYDPPGDPFKSGNIWYGGWGAPPKINNKYYGIELIWIDKEHPVQPCEWFHCGVSLKPDVTLTGARAYLTIFRPPAAPTINGPTSGEPGTSYTFTFNSVDPDDDNVRFIIDWDDDTTETTDFVGSGQDKQVSHTWTEEGTYFIKAKAEDEFGLVGPEATYTVTMPRNRVINSPFLNFLHIHPNLFPILQLLLQRLGL